MKPLTEKVEFETVATIFERSVHRPVIITIEPSGIISLRLKGTQRTYDLPVDACYHAAVKAEVKASEKGRRSRCQQRSRQSN
jgi:hypothetical protein